ncbi:hypothetical protein D3C81_1221840 [compost metagenome]
MARIAHAAVDLHGGVRRLTDQTVRPVVAHGDLVRERGRHLGLGHPVHLPGGLADHQAQHLDLGGQFDQGELDRLIDRQRLAEGLARAGVGDALLDAEVCGAQRRGGLADAVLMDEVLGQRQPAADRAEHGVGGHPDVGEADARVVRGHVEGPQILLDLDARRLGGDQQAADAVGVAGFARGAAEDHDVGGDVHPRGPHLLAVDAPAGDAVAGLGLGDGLHVGGVRTVVGLGQAEAD